MATQNSSKNSSQQSDNLFKIFEESQEGSSSPDVFSGIDELIADGTKDDGTCDLCYGRKIYLDDNGDPQECPKCASKKIVDVLQAIPEKKLVIIPDAYKGVMWNENAVRETPHLPRETVMHDNFTIFLQRMTAMVGAFSIGKLPDRSCLIAAPPGSGKNHAVYASMQGALAAGLTVAPYYDVGQIRELMKNEKMPESYWEAQVCFVKMMVGNITLSDIQVMKIVADRRARLGLPTIVMSRYPISYLSSGYLEPSLVETVNTNVSRGDFFRFLYIAAHFPFYGKEGGKQGR